MKPGTVNFSREIWDDVAFKHQPFTEREAFMWLVMEADERGHVLVSAKDVSKTWGWSLRDASLLLRRLENREIIKSESKSWPRRLVVLHHPHALAGDCEARAMGARSRFAIPKALREEVMARDGAACAYCGDKSGPLHLDHIAPWVRGGLDTADNLTVSCRACNLRKSAKTPEEWRGAK